MNDGGPAYPNQIDIVSNTVFADVMKGGMTLLDYFAGQVITKCVEMNTEQKISTIHSDDTTTDNRTNYIEAGQAARDAYAIAQSMIAEKMRLSQPEASK